MGRMNGLNGGTTNELTFREIKVGSLLCLFMSFLIRHLFFLAEKLSG